ITFHRRKNREERAEAKKRGYVKEKTFINVSADVCESCLECTMATGCPGLSFTETDFGRKIQTDLSWCVGDMACTKIHACPSFEEITIYRSQKPPSRLPNIADGELPEPVIPDFDHQWHVYRAGVGGMGIASATATLVRAAHREGYETLFCDKNGLAIRNGGVYSQVTFLRPGCNHTSSVIPYGKADLILGIDPLEAARSLDPKGNQRIGSVAHTAAVINTAKTPTIFGLLGKDDYCVETLETSIRRHTRGDDYFSCDISDHSQRIFGTKIYANVMMLGVAFQRGLLPLSLASIEWGIRETVGSAAADNYLAFKVGRKLVIDAERSGGATVTAAALTPEQTVEAKAGMLLRAEGRPASEAYRQLVRRGFDAIELDAKNRTRLATRLADLILFEDAAFASDYLDRLLAIHTRDKASFGFAATHAALWNLHRAMVIKDEVFVAALLSGEEKKQRDIERYNVHPELGDRVVYGHLNRPEFILFGKKIRFHLTSRQWMLRLMRRGKFLRRLLPAWHAEEKAFRAWFLDLASKFDAADEASYRRWLAVLRLPEQATGYREVRYPKLREARRRAEAILAGREDAALSGAKPAASASPGSSAPAAKKN
ncbi:MAG TPA: DUF6537 domain-containing protein, partial [Candidatus Methylacidiphilales bacterium]